MKAIILAAGKATRLLPFTKNEPQCLLKAGGKTILEHQVEALRKAGINEIIVVCGYFADRVEEFCKRLGIKTLLNPFYAVSNMAMSLWLAKDILKEGFLLLYSDVLFEPSVIHGLMQTKGDMCLAIKKGRPREEAEKIVEKGGLLQNVSKDKTAEENGEFIGIAKFSDRGARDLTDEMNKTAKININSSFINVIEQIIEKGKRVEAYDIKDSLFVDIDFPEDLKKAEEVFR